MHDCILCGGACYCHGDWDDCYIPCEDEKCNGCGCHEDEEYDYDEDDDFDDDYPEFNDHPLNPDL